MRRHLNTTTSTSNNTTSSSSSLSPPPTTTKLGNGGKSLTTTRNNPTPTVQLTIGSTTTTTTTDCSSSTISSSNVITGHHQSLSSSSSCRQHNNYHHHHRSSTDTVNYLEDDPTTIDIETTNYDTNNDNNKYPSIQITIKQHITQIKLLCQELWFRIVNNKLLLEVRLRLTSNKKFTTTCTYLYFTIIVILVFYKLYQQLPSSSTTTILNIEKDNTLLYKPCPLEQYIMNNMDALGYAVDDPNLVQSVCTIYTDPEYYKTVSATTKTTTTRAQRQLVDGNIATSSSTSNNLNVYDTLQQYIYELDIYDLAIRNYDVDNQNSRTVIGDDIRYKITATDKSYCTKLQIHQHGLYNGIFNKSQQLSILPNTGYIEPLVPPLRHPKFCTDVIKEDHLLSLKYLVHDFVHICQHTIERTSRTIFIDLGASLQFHTGINVYDVPSIQLLELYRKFGILFDHIYAYEATSSNPFEVYETLPQQYHNAYHWINFPVSADPNHFGNPIKLLYDNYNVNDFIVVKLDIDTSVVEMGLIDMILSDKKYYTLIDQLYFEHHVVLKDLLPWWTNSVNGTVRNSLELFTKLRQLGIAAHYWP